jgi:hypothetical protein
VKKLRKKTIGGFPWATLPGSIDDTVQHIQSKKEANDWALATVGKVQALGRGHEKILYGLDTENNVDKTHEIM